MCQLAALPPTKVEGEVAPARKASAAKILYGTASYYADKFTGRKTATGDTYSHVKMTAACNRLPLGSWIRVTNLRNNRAVIVQVNDRLHPKNKRVVDMSRIAAEQLGYIDKGLTEVKVEVLSTRVLKKSDMPEG
ncbi:MAG TPA: septal ring lytic transglycosylase RlpA family protein [Flavisolibacter sp.]|nr:septal ring lytic transglycosylase RlpA family protein [Flavisolibacter sp.]